MSDTRFTYRLTDNADGEGDLRALNAESAAGLWTRLRADEGDMDDGDILYVTTRNQEGMEMLWECEVSVQRISRVAVRALPRSPTPAQQQPKQEPQP